MNCKNFKKFVYLQPKYLINYEKTTRHRTHHAICSHC